MTDPDHHLEIETKLEIDPGVALPDVLQNGAVVGAGIVALSDPVVHDLEAAYWDTVDLRLLDARHTLRRRTGGTDAGWHLKLPAPVEVSGEPGARSELRLPLGDTQVPAVVADRVAPLLDGGSLVPVATLRTRRTVQIALDALGTAVLEIADDEVSATRPDGHTDRWREIEVEILDGTTDQLTAVVDALVAGGARATPRASKVARALGRG